MLHHYYGIMLSVLEGLMVGKYIYRTHSFKLLRSIEETDIVGKRVLRQGGEITIAYVYNLVIAKMDVLGRRP